MPEHPAKFSQTILDAIPGYLPKGGLVLDPFAGTGRVHRLRDVGPWWTVGVEIEPEWAKMDPRTIVGNALALPFADSTFDAVVTSPVYGNRMSDHFDARDSSKRHTYRHTLGRPLHEANSGRLRWGDAYRAFHAKAWCEVARVLKPGGRFVLNVSDFIKAGEHVPVSQWHHNVVLNSGFNLLAHGQISTPRQRHGQNGNLRVNHENLYLFERARKWSMCSPVPDES